LVLSYALCEDRQVLYVLTESSEGEKAVKHWAIGKITFEDGLFVHSNIQTFFTLEGANKQFCLVQGLEWSVIKKPSMITVNTVCKKWSKFYLPNCWRVGGQSQK